MCCQLQTLYLAKNTVKPLFNKMAGLFYTFGGGGGGGGGRTTRSMVAGLLYHVGLFTQQSVVN